MRNCNKDSRIGYIVSNTTWALMAMVLYRTVLFRVVDGLSLLQSKGILWALMVGCVLSGVLLTIKHRRNGFSVFVNVMLPYEIYATITYWPSVNGTIRWVSLTAMGLSIAYFAWVLVVNWNRWQVKPGRGSVAHGLMGIRSIVVTCFAVLWLSIAVNTAFGNGQLLSRVKPEGGNDQTVDLADYEDVLGKLQNDIWQELTVQQRLDTLQVVANIECSRLGLPHELTLDGRIMDEHINAFYTDSLHSISVNLEYLEQGTSYQLLKTVCHEAYHAYQFRLCDVWDTLDRQYQQLKAFEYVRSYKSEFCNYVEGTDDFVNYYIQACEVTARAYAEDTVLEVYLPWLVDLD